MIFILMFILLILLLFFIYIDVMFYFLLYISYKIISIFLIFIIVFFLKKKNEEMNDMNTNTPNYNNLLFFKIYKNKSLNNYLMIRFLHFIASHFCKNIFNFFKNVITYLLNYFVKINKSTFYFIRVLLYNLLGFFILWKPLFKKLSYFGLFSKIRTDNFKNEKF